MSSRRFYEAQKKKECHMWRPRPSVRLTWLSMTKPFNQRCRLKPVKTQQDAQFTDQLHVPTIHDHHRAGQKKEDMFWDCYLNALHMLIYHIYSLGNNTVKTANV